MERRKGSQSNNGKSDHRQNSIPIEARESTFSRALRIIHRRDDDDETDHRDEIFFLVAFCLTRPDPFPFLRPVRSVRVPRHGQKLRFRRAWIEQKRLREIPRALVRPL